MEEQNNKEVIDLREVWKLVWSKKRLFFKVWGITFVVSCLIIFPVPRTYQASVSMVPETSSVSTNSLSSLASTFGFNMGNMTSEDAFYPDIYPEVVASNNFIADLLTIQVKSQDGDINMDYRTYLTKHQQHAFYTWPFRWMRKQLKEWTDEPKPKTTQGTSKFLTNEAGCFVLSEEQIALFETVRAFIACSVDKKTGVITISVTDQDPLICAAMANSTRLRLQEFITQYRTEKARVDYEYYSKLTDSAKKEYEEALRVYGIYCDSHLNTIMQSEQSKRDELENDLSIKLNTYNTMNTQLVAAKAKVQEATPAFSLMESPVVPVKPSGPKRMLFVAAMLLLTSIGTIAYLFKKDILKNIYRTA